MKLVFKLKEQDKKMFETIWRRTIENESAINTLFYEIEKIKNQLKLKKEK